MIVASIDWGFIWAHLPELLRGLEKTLEVSAIAIAGAFAVGLVLGAVRAYRVPVLSQLAAVYVEVIRNTPILVQIFFLFYGLPQFGIRLTPYTTAWLSVMVWGGAFNTENFRAGFGAVRRATARGRRRSDSARSRRSSTSSCRSAAGSRCRRRSTLQSRS